MDNDVRHVTLGFVIALCVVTLSWNIDWRHYSNYAALIFPKSFRTDEKRAIRIFFAFCFVGSVIKLIDVVASSPPSLGDLGWSLLWTAITAVVFFAIDAILRW